MKFDFLQKQTSRRNILRGSLTLAGSAFLAHLFPRTLLRVSAASRAQESLSPAELLASMRAKFNAVPLETQTLAENVTMFDGPGGAVAVLNGPDGKFIVDTFVAPAWPRLKGALDALGNAPVQYVIDTHWHFDHTDNNAHLHAAGDFHGQLQVTSQWRNPRAATRCSRAHGFGHLRSFSKGQRDLDG